MGNRYLTIVRRAYLGAAVLCSLATSCVTPVDFVLVNRSAQSIEISFFRTLGDATDPLCQCPSGFRTPALATGPALSEFGVVKAKWTPIDTTLLTYNVWGKVQLILPAHSVLRLDRGAVLSQDRSEPILPAIFTLELRAPGIEVVLTQPDLVVAFKKWKSTLYVYEITG